MEYLNNLPETSTLLLQKIVRTDLKKLIIPFLFIFVTTYFSQAQPPLLTLDSITLTANLSSQKQKETGRNITLIKGEYFNKLPAHSIDELLRYLPGIEIQQRGPQGTQSDIVIRGGTFQQVLVIIDGVKLNDPLTGHFNSFIPIHPQEIDRIEILKGAASAIWGSEAVGGVVNIITKTFNETKQETYLRAGVAGGQYGLYNGNGYFNYSKNKTTISAGILQNKANGQQLRGTTGFFNLATVNVSFAQALKNNWSLHARIAADFRKFNAQNFYTTFGSDTSNEKVNSFWNQINLRKKMEKGQLNVDVAYKQLRDQYWFQPSSIPNDNKTNLFSTQIYYSTQVNRKLGYTTGVQFIRKEIISNDRGNHQLLHGAVYGIMRHSFANSIFINESVRLDWDESYGVVLVPQINVAWSPSQLTLRASAGKSFRDADFTERYNNYNKALVTSGRIGNPDLQAERSWNLEAGADYQFNQFLKLSTTLFYRDHSNLIDYSITPYSEMPRKVNLSPTGSYALAKNVESVKTTGVEIDLVFNRQFNSNHSFYATTGITWLESKNNDPVPSFYISSHAKWLINFSAAYNFNQFSFSMSGIYKKRNEQQSSAINAYLTTEYYVMNLKASYQLPKKFAIVYLQADNLFNKKYSDLLGALMPGSWLSAGIEVTCRRK